jgi:2-C-methyl-D-erythritol 4-phosphate cytidylyltransferase
MLLGKRIRAIVPAAGKGRRMDGNVAKQFLELHGKPILVHTLERLTSMSEIDEVIVAAAEDDRMKIQKMIADYRIGKIEKVIIGGNERQDSIWNCLQQLSGDNDDVVIVHDAVRPFVTRDLVVDVCTVAIEVGAAIPVVQPRDTVKTLNGSGFIKATLNRNELVMAQTPQAFRFSLLFEAYQQAMNDRFYGTDDASLVERNGGKVKVVDGLVSNMKITTPEDMLIAQHVAQ